MTRSVSGRARRRGRVVERGHPQHGPDVQVQLAARRSGRPRPPAARPAAGQPPGEHLRDLHGAAEAAVERGEHGGAVVERAVGADRHRVDADDRGRGGDAGQRGERGVVAAASRPGRARRARRRRARRRGTAGRRCRCGSRRPPRRARRRRRARSAARGRPSRASRRAACARRAGARGSRCRHGTGIMRLNARARARAAARGVARGPRVCLAPPPPGVARTLARRSAHMGKLGAWRRDMPSTSSSPTTT